MKLIILVASIFLVVSCSNTPQPSNHYVGLKTIIVKMGVSSAGTPTFPILVRLIGNDTIPNNLYTEFTDDHYIGQMKTAEWLYNHKIGDTLSFDYIKKDRFFTISKALPNNNATNNTSEVEIINYN